MLHSFPFRTPPSHTHTYTHTHRLSLLISYYCHWLLAASSLTPQSLARVLQAPQAPRAPQHFDGLHIALSSVARVLTVKAQFCVR